jgi:predicted small lipoprotein YifL
MKTVIFGIVILAMISIFLNGCGQSRNPMQRPDTDVTLSPEYNFKSFAGTVWKTKTKVRLADVKLYTGRHITMLLPPEDFKPNNRKYRPPDDMRLIAVLPVGTRLRIERLEKDNGNWGGVRVTASLEDGNIVYPSDYLLGKNRFIWSGWSESKDWGVDPDMLEKAE